MVTAAQAAGQDLGDQVAVGERRTALDRVLHREPVDLHEAVDTQVGVVAGYRVKRPHEVRAGRAAELGRRIGGTRPEQLAHGAADGRVSGLELVEGKRNGLSPGSAGDEGAHPAVCAPPTYAKHPVDSGLKVGGLWRESRS